MGRTPTRKRKKLSRSSGGDTSPKQEAEKSHPTEHSK